MNEPIDFEEGMRTKSWTQLRPVHALLLLITDSQETGCLAQS